MSSHTAYTACKTHRKQPISFFSLYTAQFKAQWTTSCLVLLMADGLLPAGAAGAGADAGPAVGYWLLEANTNCTAVVSKPLFACSPCPPPAPPAKRTSQIPFSPSSLSCNSVVALCCGWPNPIELKLLAVALGRIELLLRLIEENLVVIGLEEAAPLLLYVKYPEEAGHHRNHGDQTSSRNRFIEHNPPKEHEIRDKARNPERECFEREAPVILTALSPELFKVLGMVTGVEAQDAN
jgi:hypothetical protein